MSISFSPRLVRLLLLGSIIQSLHPSVLCLQTHIISAGEKIRAKEEEKKIEKKQLFLLIESARTNAI
jgi:hypothetical protein